MFGPGTPDPQWDLTLAIRSALELGGRFTAEIDERNAQARVDLHWAALQAGRLLGSTVKVDPGARSGTDGSLLAVTVVCVGDDRNERARAQEGLEGLRRSVRQAQTTPCCTPAIIPHPRTARRLVGSRA